MDRVAEAEAELERNAPGYLERVRRLAAERAVPATPAEQVSRAVEMVAQGSTLDPNVPLNSQRRAGRAVKRAVATLTRFYFLHLTEQVTDLGHSTAWMGSALQDYVCSLEERVAALEAELASRRDRPPGT